VCFLTTPHICCISGVQHLLSCYELYKGTIWCSTVPCIYAVQRAVFDMCHMSKQSCRLLGNRLAAPPSWISHLAP